MKKTRDRVLTKPNSRELSEAREHFRVLLSIPTKESQWQDFFSEHPYVLSMSLPLKLQPTDIIPLGRQGKAEPDFVFYPRDQKPIPFYGVVELKRPDTKILTITRSNVALLSRDAETAIEQARVYAHSPSNLVPLDHTGSIFFLGNRAHLFVIMGLSQELTTKLSMELYKETLEKKLPDNLRLIPYDILLQMFEANIPPRVYSLSQVVRGKSLTEKTLEITGRVERAMFNSITADIPEKGTYLVVEFFESDRVDCLPIVITKVRDNGLPDSVSKDIGTLNSTYPKVKVTVKPHKGNLVPSGFLIGNYALFEALSDFEFL